MKTVRFGSYGSLALAVLALLAFGRPAGAGAPDPGGRAGGLQHVCSRGGTPCVADGDCAKGHCVVAFERTSFSGVLTLVADDDVAQYSGNASVAGVHAASVLLELRTKAAGRQVLAQTYQNIDGSTFGDLVAALQQAPFLSDTFISGQPTTEQALVGASVNDITFQQPDGEMADAMRALFGSLGTPVVLEGKVKLLDVTDHSGAGDHLASVVRFKVKGSFATLAP
jgi:hypothetical protein